MKTKFSITLFTLLNLSIMAKEIKTQITINQTPEKVWSILTNFNDYGRWNPFIVSITGKPLVGNILVVVMKLQENKEMTFKPKVVAFANNEKLIWKGKLLMKCIFDGEHQFYLIDNGNGTTTFIQNEKFNGILVPFMKNLIEVDTFNNFKNFNEAIKIEAEKLG